MSRLRILASRLRGLFARERRERDLDEEVRFHLQMQAEANLKTGMDPEEARYAARRSFGGIEPMKETYREHRAVALVETTAQDIRYALRTLRKSPSFAITSVAVLALAIGANTAMFSVLNAVLLRPLPFPSPDQLTMLWTEAANQNLREGRTGYASFEQWRTASKSFSDMAVFDPGSATLTNAEQSQRISVLRMSANLLPLLGIPPAIGRIFSAEEAEQRQRLVLISDQFWQSRYAGSPNAIGATIDIDGVSSQIIGILPPGLLMPNADVLQPHTTFPDWETRRTVRGAGSWFVVGRLRAAVTIEQAQSELSAIARGLDDPSRGIGVAPLSLQFTGTRSRLALWMLTGAVFCVLLIAATNVASLSLARSSTRDREMAVRVALGASRGRILRQLLAEGVTMALIAGLLGLAVAQGGIRLIQAMQPPGLARLNEAALDPHVLGWALALCLLTGILVGLAPAITLKRHALGGRGVAGGVAASGVRRALVVTEFALALALLAGAGLLIRSLWSAQNVDLGFRPERVLSMQLSTSAFTSTAQRTGFYNRVIEQVEALPGVESAALVEDLFIGNTPERRLTAEGHAEAEQLRFRADAVTASLFATVGTPLLKGRLFSVNEERVAIVNDALARRLWPTDDPLGKRFKFGPRDSAQPWITVIGVVGDMRRQGLEAAPIPQIFQPLAEDPQRLATLLVRTSAENPLDMAASVQATVRQVEKYVPQYGVTTLEARLGGFLTERRFQTSLLMGFSGVALVMAAIGIYGLIQYSIAMRTREIGIRMALGAQADGIFRMVIQEGLKLSLAGAAIGLAGALWLGRAVSGLLFGVTATDPWTFASVSLLLIVVAAAACYFPARRAMKVEPVVALREG